MSRDKKKPKQTPNHNANIQNNPIKESPLPNQNFNKNPGNPGKTHNHNQKKGNKK